MMKYFKNLYVLLIIFTLSSCALPSKTMKTFMDSSKDEGMIVGTICIEDMRYTGYTFFYEYSKANLLPPKNVDSYGSVKILTSFGESDYKIDKNRYYLFNVVKPAAKYKFYKLTLFLNTGYMQSTREVEINQSFNIEKGKITYLGELKLNTKTGIFELNNQIERDRLWFKEKFPTFSF